MTVPLTRAFTFDVTSLANSTPYSAPALVVPWAAQVVNVQYVPAATMASATATANTQRHFTLTNKGGSSSASGTATGVIAAAALTSLSTTLGGTRGQFGTGLLGDVASTLSLNTVTTSLTVAAGDILMWESSHSATGVTDVGGRVVITLSRI